MKSVCVEVVAVLEADELCPVNGLTVQVQELTFANVVVYLNGLTFRDASTQLTNGKRMDISASF